MKNIEIISDELLVKFMLNESTHEEQAEVNEWLEKNHHNSKYLEDLITVWATAGRLSVFKPVDVDESWKRFSHRIQSTDNPRPFIKNIKWKQIAAVFIPLVIVGAIFFSLFTRERSSIITLRSSDKVRIDTLPDASIITLNKNSALNYPSNFNSRFRTVSLTGEAFFKITPDKNKPFLVKVNNVTVKVVGTAFNIKSQMGNTEVIVESGIVEVKLKNKIVTLKPHEKVFIRQSDSTMYKEEDSEKLYNYYRTRKFICDKTPLWKLVKVLNEVYSVHIEIDGSELNNLPLNTTFNNDSLDHILQVIKLTFNVATIENGNSIIIKKIE